MGLKALPLMSVEDSRASKELHEDELEYALDDHSEEALDPKLAKKARREEMAYFKEMKTRSRSRSVGLRRAPRRYR